MHPSTLTFHQERILAVLLHIQRHLDEDLGLDCLAKVAHLSPFHMHRIFKSLVGEGVAEHVRRLRLERAATRLKFSATSVLELALEAGFESHEAFTRAFSAHFGEPPARYRKAHHAQLFSPVPSGIHYAPHGALDHFVPQGASPQGLPVDVVERPPVEVAFVRRIGSYYTSAAQAWERLLAWHSRLPEGPLEAYGICHDDPSVTAESRLRYDAALPWREGMRVEGDIGRQHIEGGLYLRLLQRIPANNHDAAWEALVAWAVRSPYRLRILPSLEIYRDAEAQDGTHLVACLIPVEMPQ